jgi:hypothetical protein
MKYGLLNIFCRHLSFFGEAHNIYRFVFFGAAFLKSSSVKYDKIAFLIFVTFNDVFIFYFFVGAAADLGIANRAMTMLVEQLKFKGAVFGSAVNSYGNIDESETQ